MAIFNFRALRLCQIIKMINNELNVYDCISLK